MDYRTVFDVNQVGFQWWIPFLIFVFSSIFVGIGSIVKTSKDKGSFNRGIFFQIVGAIGISASIAFLVITYAEYRKVQNTFATRSYSIVEGVVTKFTPMPPGGHSIETFVVNGVRFEYGSGWGSTTFNSEWNKGFIHNGVDVRITYMGKDIIKVELK